jgi:hypothetical protein
MDDYKGNVYLIKYEFTDHHNILITNQAIWCASSSVGNACKCIKKYLASNGNTNANIYACVQDNSQPGGMVVVDTPDDSGGGSVIIDPTLELTLVGDTDDPENPATWFNGMAFWLIPKNHRGSMIAYWYAEFDETLVLFPSVGANHFDSPEFYNQAYENQPLQARAFIGPSYSPTSIGPILNYRFQDIGEYDFNYVVPGGFDDSLGTNRPMAFPTGYAY